ARLLGVPVITPSPLQPFGLETAPAPHLGSGLAIYDFGVDLSVYAKAEPADQENPVHDTLRLQPAAIDQLDRFLTTGMIEDTC
ncbi:hypothetical protein, partial [Salmonella sp. SAL4448]|uniref:hypothetical protein n=1 Tax=Salmonella sp. SAL4448 TaxID=3159903 RepID=UPI0039792A21